MTFKILFSDYEYESLEIEENVIKEQIPDVEFIYGQCKTEEEVIAIAKDVDAIINQYAPLGKKVIDSLTNCKVISRYGVGFNTIDVKAATEKGITVSNVSDYCLDEVSDHAMALLLSLARKVTFLNKKVKSGTWDYKKGMPIHRIKDSKLGLLSFGNIAQKVALKAQSFGMKIIAYDPYVPEKVAKELNVELVSFEELFKESDYISVHTPLNKATEGMVGTEQFKSMKEKAFIINTSRGQIIDEKALIDALQNNELAGAGLDVLELEPIEADNPLLQMDQVILNPHVAWHSMEAEKELKLKTAQNVADVLQGKEPKYIVPLKN